MSGTVAYDRDSLTGQFTQHGNTLYNTPIPATQNHDGVDPETTQAVRDGDEDTRKRIDDTAKKTDIGRAAVAALGDKDQESGDDFDDSPTPERGEGAGGGQPASASPAGGGMPQMPQAQAPQLNAPVYNIPPELLAQLIQGMQDFESGPQHGVPDGLTGGELSPTGPAPISAGNVAIQKTGIGTLNNDQVHSVINQALDLNGVPNDSGVRDKWNQLLVYMAKGESGFNPDAVNTGDSNAHGAPATDGNPFNCSRGIWQTIPTTFAANHVDGTSNNIYDPLASGAAAVRYIMSNYHVSPDGAGIEEFASERGMGQGFYRGY